MSWTGRCKQYYSRVMDLPDAPVRVARGAAVGLALDFLPIPLISIPFAYVVARLLGGNGIAAALTAAFFKLAVPFFYVLNMATGTLLIGWRVPVRLEPVTVSTASPADWLDKLAQLGYPFLVGAAVNALLAGLLLYILVRKLLLLRQKRKGIVKEV